MKQILCFAFCLFITIGFTSQELQAQSETPNDELPFIFGGVAWSPNGDRLAVGTSDGVWLHSTEDLSVLSHLNDTRFITTLDWSHDGERIALGNAAFTDSVVQIWDAVTGQLLHSFEDPEHQIASVRWSPDDQFLAGASWDQTIRVWDADSGIKTHTIPVDDELIADYSVFWDPEGQHIASSTQYGISIWDVATEAITQRFDDAPGFASFAWSPDGETFAVGGRIAINTHGVELWDVSSQQLVSTLEFQDPRRWMVMALAWSPDSSLLALNSIGEDAYRNGELIAESDGGVIQIWDVETETMIKELPNIRMTGDGNYNNAIAWSPDGSRLASISDDGHIYIWDAETFELLASYGGYRSLILTD